MNNGVGRALAVLFEQFGSDPDLIGWAVKVSDIHFGESDDTVALAIGEELLKRREIEAELAPPFEGWGKVFWDMATRHRRLADAVPERRPEHLRRCEQLYSKALAEDLASEDLAQLKSEFGEVAELLRAAEGRA